MRGRVVFRAWTKGLLFAIGLLCLVCAAQAETCTLELVSEIPTADKANGKKYPPEFFFRAVAQDFNQVIVSKQKQADPDNDPQLKAFHELVKKEPAYHSEHPMKGVIKFGGKRFAFAMDFVPEEAVEKKSEEKADKKETPKKPSENIQAEEAANEIEAAIGKTVFAFNWLYLDFNGNGDLTDDEPLQPVDANNAARYASSNFLFTWSIELDGVKLEVPCNFALNVNSFSQKIVAPDGKEMEIETQNCYGQFYSQCFREGEIKLDDKTYRVILSDFNNNGVFNDKFEDFSPESREYGDMVYIFPNDIEPDFSMSPFPINTTAQVLPFYLGSMIGALDGKFWSLEVTPSGDRLTIIPLDQELGYIQKEGLPISLTVFSKEKKSFLTVYANEEGKAALPAGQWNLLLYSIEFEKEKPKEEEKQEASSEKPEEEEEEEEKADDTKKPDVTKGTVTCLLLGIEEASLKIVENETIELPFGPPYKVAVTSSFTGLPKEGLQARLSLRMTGSSDEQCLNVAVDGKRPEKPTFVITTKDGKEVQSGAFEYG